MHKITRRHILIFILLLSAALRFWGLEFGLPNEHARPDEAMIIIVAMGMGNGDLNPHFFNYPTLYIYLCLAGFVLYYFFGSLLGLFRSAADFALAFFLDPTVFYLIGRTLSAVAGIATVYVVYLTGRKLQDERTGLLAALLLALCPLHVRDSHFGVTDVTMVFFIVASVYYSMHYLAEKKFLSTLPAAALAGLAAASKYNGLFGLAPLFLAIWLVQLKPVPFIKQALIGLAIFGLVFIAASPFVLLDHSAFLRDFNFEMSHLQSGHLGTDLGRGWWHHPTFSLWYGMGPALFLLSLAGLLMLLRQAPRHAGVLLAFPALYYFIIGRGLTVFARYALPLIPFLCITAAWGALYLLDRMWSHHRRWLVLAVPVFVGAVLLPNLHQSIQSDLLLARKDSRVIAAEWIRTHVPNGATMYQHAAFWAQVQLPISIDAMSFFAADSAAKLNPGLAHLYRLRDAHYRKTGTPLYELWTRQDSTFYYGRQQQTDLPEYVITVQSALAAQDVHDTAMDKILAHRYRQIHAIQATDRQEAAHHYDLQDAFYLPLSGFSHIRFPGPTILIFKKES